MTKWSALRAIPNTAFARSMYFWFAVVPILAKALSKLNDTAMITLGGSNLSLNLQLPFSWKIFYFSSLFFVVGNILYHAFCPTIIKHHLDYREFESSGRSVEHLKHYARELNSDYVDMPPEPPYNRKDELMAKLDEMRHNFWRLHSTGESARPIPRYLCFTCYAVAFIGLSHVAITNVAYVINTL